MSMSASTRNTAPDDVLHVAVGILADEDGRVLLARRPEGKEQAGLWEFPGGKVDPGEDAEGALERELREELGVAVASARPLIRIPHAYPHRRVLLDVWQITRYRGMPRGLEGQELVWSAPGDLSTRELLAANRPIVNAVRLPALYAITDTQRYGEKQMLEAITVAAEAGLRLLQVREKRMDSARRRRFVERVLEAGRPHGLQVVLNGDPEEALALRCDGVHLDTARLRDVESRPLADGLWVGASCHDAGELAAAARIRADYAVLSPVARTSSHPAADPLGWAAFAQLCEPVPLPVYALGGVTPADLERAWRAGAQGLSMISGLWEAADVASAVRRAQGVGA